MAEKALRAGMYAILCGLDEIGLNDHVLSHHAYALRTEKPEKTLHLSHHAVALEKFLDMCYPNRYVVPTIPSATCSLADAKEAIGNMRQLYLA